MLENQKTKTHSQLEWHHQWSNYNLGNKHKLFGSHQLYLYIKALSVLKLENQFLHFSMKMQMYFIFNN